MSNAADLLPGLLMIGAVTAVIVFVALVSARKEARQAANAGLPAESKAA